MYILKLTHKDGYSYMIESLHPDKVSKIYNIPELAKLSSNADDYTVELVKEIDDYTVNVGLVKFNCIIDDVNRTHKFNFHNGRFRVDDEFNKKKIVYVITMRCVDTNRVYVNLTRNPVSLLYRMYNEDLS